MNKVVGVVAATILLLLGLAACSEDTWDDGSTGSTSTDSPSSGSSDESSSGGKAIDGTGYTLTAPADQSWTDITSDMKEKSTLVDVAYRVSDSSTNFNITKAPAQLDTSDTNQRKQLIKAELTKVGAENIDFQGTTDMDKTPAIQVSFQTKPNAGTTVQQFQISAAHHGTVYTLTATDSSEHVAESIAKSVAASWQWDNTSR